MLILNVNYSSHVVREVDTKMKCVPASTLNRIMRQII